MATVFGRDLEDFLDLDADEVGLLLLELLRGQGDQLIEWNVMLEATTQAQHSGASTDEALAAGSRVSEGWNWLRTEGLIAKNARWSNGQEALTRAGQRADVGQYLQEARSTRILRGLDLDPQLREEVTPLFRRGKFELAVFAAMKLVEIRVRDASGLGDDMIGVKLMQEALRVDGPLADPRREPGEQQGYMALYWGAIGVYKNPHSHRAATLWHPQEALEAVLLANNLLRIVAHEEHRIAGRSG